MTEWGERRGERRGEPRGERGGSARSETRPTAFQRAIALSWFLLAAAWALIAVRTALGGYPSWWQWTLFAILSVAVGLLNLYARRWQRWARRQQNT